MEGVCVICLGVSKWSDAATDSVKISILGGRGHIAGPPGDSYIKPETQKENAPPLFHPAPPSDVAVHC